MTYCKICILFYSDYLFEFAQLTLGVVAIVKIPVKDSYFK